VAEGHFHSIGSHAAEGSVTLAQSRHLRERFEQLSTRYSAVAEKILPEHIPVQVRIVGG
jgi:hypothetical protein